MLGHLRTAAVVAALVGASTADASVLWLIDDDGSGGLRMRLSGTFDVSAEPAITSSATLGIFFSGGAGPTTSNATWTRNTTPVSSSQSRQFARTLDPGPIHSNAFFLAQMPGTSFDKFSIGLATGASTARISGNDGNVSGTLLEDVTVPTVAFSTFNPGVWEWGDPSQANQGIRLEVGQNPISAVPLPAAGWMLIASLGGVAAVRRASQLKRRSAACPPKAYERRG